MPANWTKRIIGAAVLAVDRGGAGLVRLAAAGPGRSRDRREGPDRSHGRRRRQDPCAPRLHRLGADRRKSAENFASLWRAGTVASCRRRGRRQRNRRRPDAADAAGLHRCALARSACRPRSWPRMPPSSSRRPRCSGSKPRWTSPGPNSSGRRRFPRTQSISAQAFDKAKFDVATNEAALASAKAQVDVRRSDARQRGGAVDRPGQHCSRSAEPTCCVQRARAGKRTGAEDHSGQRGRGPARSAAGRHRQSRRSGGRGRPALDRRRPDQGRRAGPDRRLGRPAVRGKVVRVDPAGFLKVSALGIEEQRVRVTIDLRPAGGLVAAWPRLSGCRPCHHLERCRRPDSTRQRAIPQRRRMGRVRSP